MNDNLLDSGPAEDNIDDNKNYLEELVGEGKKFKSPEELAKGKAEADRFIARLVQEKEELRQDLLALRDETNARTNLAELIDQLKTQRLQNEENPKVTEANTETAFKLDDVKSLVSNELQAYEREQKARSNFNQVQSKLKERFGNNYAEVLKQRRDEMGLTDEDINTLARKSPAAFFRTFGVTDTQVQETFQAPPQTQRRTDNFAPQTTKRTWSYYQKMRREQPELYHSKKTQLQMDADAISLGAEFEDGDYRNI